MDNNYLMAQINKHSEDISEIKVCIRYLQGSIDKLSICIDKLADKVDSRKGLASFFKEHWYRIPTMIVILYGAIWSANYVNDNFMPEHKKYRNSN